MLKIDDDFLEDLEMVLLSGDLGVRTTDYLMRQIRRGVTEGMISSTNEVMPFMEKTVVNMLTEDGKEDISHHPEVYLVVGVNGVGKTTTIGKLSAQFRKEGRKFFWRRQIHLELLLPNSSHLGETDRSGYCEACRGSRSCGSGV